MSGADAGERAQLRLAVRDAIGSPRRPEPAGPFDRKGWHRLAADFGLQGVRAAGRHGGLDLGVAEEMLVHEELGRALSDEPYLGTVGMVARALSALPSSDDRLTAIVAGDLVATAILDDPVSCVDGRLTGAARCVLHAAEADGLLVLAHDGDEPVVGWVDRSAVEVRPLPALDLTRRFAAVRFDGAPAEVLARGQLAGGAADAARDNTHLGLAAECVGLAGYAFELTVGYVKARRQFGRPIGGFQAVKHRCADLFVRLESARSALALAVAAAESDDAVHRRTALSVARIYCGEAAFAIAREMVHLHGGTGYTWEHPAHLYLRRARSNQVLLDPHGRQRAELAGRIGAAYATT